MLSAKQKLLEVVENGISDKEAEEILSYVTIKKKQSALAKAIRKLSLSPAIESPRKFGHWPRVSPITGKGKPPSSIIVGDRR